MLMYLRRTLSLFAFATVLCLVTATAQTSPPAQEEAEPAAKPKTEAETLQALAASHAAVLKTIQERNTAAKAASGTPLAESLQKEIVELEARREALEKDLLAISAGVTNEEYLGESSDASNLTLDQELSRLLTPLVSELRKLSKKPRALQELQDNLEVQESRRDLAQTAVTSLQAQLKSLSQSKESKQSDLTKFLQDQLKKWETRLTESQSRVHALERQIEEMQRSATSIWSGMGQAVQTFFFKRGRNILFAILAFGLVFFGLRLLYFYALKLVPISKMERLSFFSRLLGLLNQGLGLALGVFAALAVLYASGDWLLGAIAMLILLGIILAAKNGLVHYFEQVRMLLNLGSAREGERVMIDGVPWRVGSINLQTRLTNPCIDGPGLRVPIETLMGMTSRQSGRESWFPCRTGNILLLADDVLAKVDHISPDFVEITYRGGITRHIPTPEFVKMQPANLSEGFLVSSTIGLDYQHQADITRTIPRQLEADLRSGLLELVPATQLVDLSVVFKQAASSSLDLTMVAKFSGAAADQYLELRRLLQQIAVESCTKHGWTIPFQHVVVHHHPDTVS